jgi:hypothetical protein
MEVQCAPMGGDGAQTAAPPVHCPAPPFPRVVVLVLVLVLVLVGEGPGETCWSVCRCGAQPGAASKGREGFALPCLTPAAAGWLAWLYPSVSPVPCCVCGGSLSLKGVDSVLIWVCGRRR